jgi:hypothetical protein
MDLSKLTENERIIAEHAVLTYQAGMTLFLGDQAAFEAAFDAQYGSHSSP